MHLCLWYKLIHPSRDLNLWDSVVLPEHYTDLQITFQLRPLPTRRLSEGVTLRLHPGWSSGPIPTSSQVITSLQPSSTTQTAHVNFIYWDRIRKLRLYSPSLICAEMNYGGRKIDEVWERHSCKSESTWPKTAFLMRYCWKVGVAILVNGCLKHVKWVFSLLSWVTHSNVGDGEQWWWTC